jgi:tRNA (uracil-5-)-methyltransferase
VSCTGNFTIALAHNFKRCLATEISKASVAAAEENCSANSVHNTVLVRMSSQDFTDALVNGTERFRLKEIDLKSYDFKTILVRTLVYTLHFTITT